MSLKKSLKYLLIIIFTFNANLAFALDEICYEIKKTNIEHICHENLETNNTNHIEDSANKNECFECSHCSILNKFTDYKSTYLSTPATIILQNKIELSKQFYSFSIRPDGPPPKLFS